MCYIWMKDVLVLLILLSGYLPHSAFSVSLANVLIEGDSDWRLFFYTLPLAPSEKRECFQPFQPWAYINPSFIGYAYSAYNWSLLDIWAESCKPGDELHSPPSWTPLTTEVMVTRSRSESGWYTSLFEMNKLFIIHKNRGSVYLKQKLCLSPIEVLFKINTGSIETELASARTNFFRLKGLKALPPLRACQRWDIKNSLQPLSPSIRAFARATEGLNAFIPANTND